MSTRIFLKPKKATISVAGWMQSHPTKLARIVTGLVLVALAISGTWAMRQWLLQSRRAVATSMFFPERDRFSAAMQHLLEDPAMPPAISTGQEPEVQAFLRGQPLITGLVARNHALVWVRKGDRLQPGWGSLEARRFQELADLAQSRRGEFYYPMRAEDEDYGNMLSVAVPTREWVIIRQITPGSDSFERALAQAMNGKPTLRINLRHLAAAKGAPERPSHATEYQFPFSQITPTSIATDWWNKFHTEGWRWTAIPGPDLSSVIHRALVLRMSLVSIPALVLLSLVLLVNWVRRRVRRRTELVNDRLAALTHGLKTPLAVLKARCDAIRLQELDADQTQYELMRIGEEIDQLTMVVETGLHAIRSGSPVVSADRITDSFLRELVAEFDILLNEAGRTFDSQIELVNVAASSVSIRQVVQTLLENAMLHGAGAVHFSARHAGRILRIQISDEGPGLEPHQLKVIGQPFLRLRAKGAEGFSSTGMGLGLSLAIQICEKEGWGFSIVTAPNQGFEAIVEIMA